MKMGIKAKILSSTALVVFCSLLLCNTFAYQYFSDIFKTQVISDNRTKLEQTAFQVQSMCADIQNLAQYMAVNKDIQSFIKYNGNPNRAEKILGTEKAVQAIKDFVSMRDYIHSVFIVMADGDVFSNIRTNESDYQKAVKEDWYTGFKSSGRFFGYTKPHYLDKDQEGATKVISYIIRFFELKNPKNKNELVINIKQDYFENAIGLASKDFDGLLWLDKQKDVYYSLGERYADLQWDRDHVVNRINAANYPEINGKDQGNVVLFKELSNGWVFSSLISKSKMQGKIRNILSFFILFGLISISIIVIVILPIILNITRPLSRLTAAVGEVSGGRMDAEIEIQSGDELQTLGEGFNKMLKELKKYLSDSIQHEKVKRKMQIDLLLSQINPHFIYNTLNMIIYLSEQNRNGDVVVVIRNFIKILQDAVRIGEDEVFARVHEEMEVVALYIKIMEYRYPDRFSLSWSVDESLLDYLIPRTILQPIIENSLFHGILPMDEKGRVEVIIAHDGANLRIEVIDNGIGMDHDFIDGILYGHRVMERGAKMRSIGLFNIMERIQFVYGPEYGLAIESLPGVSTRVIIVIPAQKE